MVVRGLLNVCVYVCMYAPDRGFSQLHRADLPCQCSYKGWDSFDSGVPFVVSRIVLRGSHFGNATSNPV